MSHTLLASGEDEDTVEDADMHDAERDGEEPPIPTARFWEALLRERHQQLLQQDEDACSKAVRSIDAMGSMNVLTSIAICCDVALFL